MIRAKRSLGQNFLVDHQIINQILDIVDIKDKNVLEVGPGTGNLTGAILNKKPKKLLVIEKDDYLASLLEKNFEGKIKIVNEDILKINENSLDNETLTVFGNLPYNISTEILCKWILNINNQNFWFDYLILMFQKEVADRIIAKVNSKNYGRLSILSNWKLDVKKICDVKPISFFPKPKIDSSVLFFVPKKIIFRLKNPESLETITRIFFRHRRKMIKKPYNQLFAGSNDIASKLNINLNLRPQNLDFETYFKIAREYENLSG